MRLLVQTFICCCVFSTMVLRGASEEPGGLRRRLFRLRGRLQSHMKRETHGGVEMTSQQSSGQHDGRQEEAVSHPTSIWLHTRSKRSPSKKSGGCIFITCSYHDLLHRLHDLNNKQKEDKAPPKKIGCHGYGRRRRRSVPSEDKEATAAGRRRPGSVSC